MKEDRRLQLLNEIERRGIGGKQAAQLLQVSVRHYRRLRAAYKRNCDSSGIGACSNAAAYIQPRRTGLR
ncbi:MAG: helix-turn-helix domain-containing protein [Chloroflexi bacterium]|nr:helix-turn-helix domain-containing protein [Chloroflexota bacterium]